MSTEMPPSFLTCAIEWHVRLRDGTDATWDAFAEWIVADPRHAAAYDEIEAMDGAIEPLVPALRAAEPANDRDEAQPGRRLGWWAAGLSVALLVAGLPLGPRFGSQRYEVATADGQQGSVRLDAGTEIALNGATKVVLDHRNPRYAALVYGQALFQVRHDAAHPFVVEVGEQRVTDRGTTFDVVRDRAETRIAVAEGRVEYRGRGTPVTLAAGQMLRASQDRPPEVSATTGEAVGAWRHRRLLYAGAPLSQVASDLGRMLGVPIRVSPEIADRPIYGNLQVTGITPPEIRRLEIALDVTLAQQDEGWLMNPSRSARP